MNQLIGFLLMALTLSLALLLTESYLFLLDPVAIAVILGAIFGVSFLSYGAQAFSIFKYANRPVQNQKEYFWVISFFDNLSNTSLITGVLLSNIGVVAMLSTHFEQITFNSKMAMHLLPIAYALVLAKFIFEPLKQNVLRRTRIANINTNVQRHIEQNNKLAHHFIMLGVANLLGCFVVVSLNQMS